MAAKTQKQGKPKPKAKTKPKAKKKAGGDALSRLSATLAKAAAPRAKPKAKTKPKPVEVKAARVLDESVSKRFGAGSAQSIVAKMLGESVHLRDDLWEALNINQQAMILAIMLYPRMVSKACAKAGVDRSTHYKWRKESPAYKEACEIAVPVGIEMHAALLRDRVVDGVKTPVFYKGERIPIMDPRVPVMKDAAGDDLIVSYQGEKVQFRGWEETVAYDGALAQWLMGALDPRWAPKSRHSVSDDNQGDDENEFDTVQQAFKKAVPDYAGGDVLDPTVALNLMTPNESEADMVD